MSPEGPFRSSGPRVFTIDAGRPFLSDLAAALLAAFPDPLALSEVEVWLPNRRAARALGEAFLQEAGGRALLLPRVRRLGEDDEDDLVDDDDHAPAIAAFERRLVLARLVAAAGGEGRAWSARFSGALAGADALGRLLDSLYAEEVDPAALRAAAPERFVRHWAETLRFLDVVLEAWPAYLESRGLEDPAKRRAAIIARAAERIATRDAGRPVVVAGTTGSAPPVRRLVKAVAARPDGAVVLPGLDRALAADARGWDAVDDGHPQGGLKILLRDLGLSPGDVRPWPGSGGPAPRARLLSVALRPADATDDWRRRLAEATVDDPGAEQALAGVELVEAADEDEEAAVVACALRATLEEPCATAMLVTPDRGLSRRVGAVLRRWNVEVSDSAGAPLAETPCGVFLRLAAARLLAPDDASAALALARHPFARFGMDGDRRRRAVDAFDRACRDVVPAPEAGGLAALVARSADAAATAAFAALAAPPGFAADGVLPFAALLDAHVAFAAGLAADETGDGERLLWRGAEGAVAAALVADARAAGETLGEVRVADYAAAFDALLAASTAPPSPGHPRLAILGPLEARLQTAGFVVIGGLDEGVWPSDGGVDPFLSRAVRRAAGLPSPERAIGLSAHDFAQAASAPRVLLTRARRRGGAPARPSRWIVRLKNILEAAGALPRVEASAARAALVAALDEAGPARPVAAPAPRPPAAARPRRLHATDIETFLRDPYAIYARRVLGLRPLAPPGESFQDRHLGVVLHAVYERAVRDGVDPEAEDAAARLAAFLAETAPRHGMTAPLRALYAPQLGVAIEVFLRDERERRRTGRPALVEAAGEATLALASGPFALAARADRIDLLEDGRAAVIDYKKTLPSRNEMLAFRQQLQLIGWIVEAGGFSELGPTPVAALSYVAAAPRIHETDSELRLDGAEAREAIDRAAAGAREWLETFSRTETPYLSQPRPKFLNTFGDYDLLARRREWATRRDE